MEVFSFLHLDLDREKIFGSEIEKIFSLTGAKKPFDRMRKSFSIIGMGKSYLIPLKFPEECSILLKLSALI